MASLSRRFEVFSRLITHWTGSTAAFLLALLTVVVWSLTGPVFHYSETWQLVINTGTTVITFLMVFLIQRAQNKDSLALHVKLNELIAATKGASNRMVNAEDLNEAELTLLHQYYTRLVEEARRDADLYQTHSVEEAAANQEAKDAHRRQRQTDQPAP
jgi:low affinity Fe/Cu permease